MFRRKILAIGLLGLLGCGALQAASELVSTHLRCEYLKNPLGIDEPKPRLSWQVVATDPKARGLKQSAYQVVVASSPELLAKNQGDLWDSGKVASSRSLHVDYAGKPLVSLQHCVWKVCVWTRNGEVWSKPAAWTMGFLKEEEWRAKWIGTSNPLPLLRREFAVSKPVRRATAYIAGLGFHELRLNGAKVGNHELEPGWTHYRKTCEYSAYDVTQFLKQGPNALGVMLGNGMYNVTGGRYTKFKGSFGDLKLILHLRVEYSDGTTDSVVSDDTWRASAGPVVFSCIYGGEDYDARKEIAEWDKPGFQDSAWTPVVILAGSGGKLTTRSAPPIVIKEEFRPVKITQPRPGVFVYDLGQNFSGWPALSVSGPAGTTVKLITGEAMNTNELVSQRSSGSPVWFSYTLKGAGTEVWHPRFSYSGFRYVQMEGAVPASETTAGPEKPRVQQLLGQFLYPETAVEGEFACSNPQVNQIHALILAAIKSNFKSVMTDCPHREKLGWLECAHLLAGCFMYNYDCARFYEKIAGDMRDAQLDNGLVPDIAPEYTVFPGGFRDSPEWGSACVIAPWRAYRMYGDLKILQDNYDVMKRYVAYLGGKAKTNIVSHGLGDWCDVGPGSPGVSKLTSLGLTATGVYYQDIDILRQIAGLLGKGEDAIAYTKLAEEVKTSFNETFFRPEKNQYDRNSQTGNAMPLFLGLVAPERRAAVLDNVVRDIRAGGNRVTAGDVGFYYVVQAFLNGGRSDVLYDMLLQTNGPGYLYQIKQRATSLPETWDANPGSSLNHCMLGHIEEWFYSGLLGISADAPGFGRIIINPQPVGGLAWAKGHYDSLHGRIQSSWKRDGDRLTLEIAIPPNTTATVYVPARDAVKVTEGGKPASEAPGVKLLRHENGAAVYEIASGAYRFESTDMGVGSKN
jgi:alpha-L-rhamnosidase